MRRPGTTIAMCALVQGVGGGLGWSVVPALMPTLAKDLGLSHAAGGAVFGAASLGIAVAAPFGGAAVDRLGPRRVAGAAMLFGALACAARVLASGPWSLAAAMLLFGAHVGFVAPAVPKALAMHVRADRVARANGLAVLAYTVGTALTMLAARSVLLPAFGGWRSVMLFAAGTMAIAALAWTALVRDGDSAARHASVMDSFALARDPGVRRVAAMHFLLFGGYLAMLSLLPRALGEAGLAPAKIGLAIAAWLLTAGAANYAGPWLSDRLRRRRPIFVAGAFIAALALAACAAAPVGLVPALLVVGAVGGGSFAPLLLTAPFELPNVGPARGGAALGLLMLVGQAGGFLLPVVVGAAAGAGGFAAAMAVLALVHAAILLPAVGVADRADSVHAAAASS